MGAEIKWDNKTETNNTAFFNPSCFLYAENAIEHTVRKSAETGHEPATTKTKQPRP